MSNRLKSGLSGYKHCCTLIVIMSMTVITAWAVVPRKARIASPSTVALVPGGQRSIPPRIDANGVSVKRVLIPFPAGDCVVERFPLTCTTLESFLERRQDNFGEVVYQPANPWYVGQDEGYCTATFNCATFAVGDHVGLTIRDWTGTSPTAEGYPTPIAVILESHFQLVCEFDLLDATVESQFLHDDRLQDGDVVAFEFAQADEDPLHRRFSHLGRVQQKDGANRLLSKFGQGPVALTDLGFASRLFPGGEVLRIYRYND